MPVQDIQYQPRPLLQRQDALQAAEAEELDFHLESDSKPFRKRERFAPSAPQNLEETGLANSTVEQLMLKLLYFKGDIISGELARAMGLRFSLIEEMIEAFKFQQLLQVKSSLGYGPVSAVLSLTERGRHVARDYLDVNQYVGPAPVPVFQYCAAVQAQRMPAVWLTKERLAKVYSHMVVTDTMLNQIGPAIASGKSLLIYGQPGNGKTYIAEALSNIDSSDIYVPYALESQGNIIQLYDPIYHQLVSREKRTRTIYFSLMAAGRDAGGRSLRRAESCRSQCLISAITQFQKCMTRHFS